MGSPRTLLRVLLPLAVVVLLGGAIAARAERAPTTRDSATPIPEIDRNPDADRLTVAERGLVYIYWLDEDREELCEVNAAGELVRDLTFRRPADLERLRKRLLQQWRVTRLADIPAARKRDQDVLRSLGYL